jgi:sortase A
MRRVRLRMRVRGLLLGSAALASTAGLTLLREQAYLRAKAWLAGRLIERAYGAHLADGKPHRPWRWADHHPIARIEVPRLGVRRIVLSGASGSSFAFGLGHVDGTALPGEGGNSVVTGHRDSWAAFLGRLRVGDPVLVETRRGTRRYLVRELRVVHKDQTELLDPTAGPQLTFVTCYPFSRLARGPWRYAVTCSPGDNELAGDPRCREETLRAPGNCLRDTRGVSSTS